jgi:hypothetical protein
VSGERGPPGKHLPERLGDVARMRPASPPETRGAGFLSERDDGGSVSDLRIGERLKLSTCFIPVDL